MVILMGNMMIIHQIWMTLACFASIFRYQTQITELSAHPYCQGTGNETHVVLVATIDQ